MIPAVILAAGKSTRMGRLKATLPAGGKPGESLDVRWLGDVAGERVEKITLMLKYAAYEAESLFTDTDKLWFSMEYAF